MVAILIAWVGISRLQELNSKVATLGSDTIPKVIKSEEIRSHVLIAIREQKNANLASTDEDSEKFAAASRRAIVEAERGLADLRSSVSDSADRELVQKVESTLAEMKLSNEACLALAVQNTNLKAQRENFMEKPTSPTDRRLRNFNCSKKRFRVQRRRRKRPKKQQQPSLARERYCRDQPIGWTTYRYAD